MLQASLVEPGNAPAVQGLKYFDQLNALLKPLHDVGCKRDAAHNRKLHFDQYCMLILLYLFNPAVKTLRGLQQTSELKNVQRRLGCPRISLGSFSESATVFEPQRLKEIIGELGGRLQPHSRDPRLQDLRHTVTLVDATLLTALPRMAEASFLKATNDSGLVKWRLHTHFEIDRHVPTRIDVTRAAGDTSDERAVLERTIEADRLYVMDRGYAKFRLFNQIVAAPSSYVCRIRDNSTWEVIEERSLSPAAVAERVTSDAIITLGATSKKQARPDHKMRLITIQCKPHRKAGRSQRYSRKGSTGPACDGVLRLVTNLLDVPAEIIALLYLYRWTIEIFFRFFKQVLGCRHLLSHSQNGIEIQTYCAIIACMLISLWTDKKPTLRTYEMLCWYLMGVADLDEMLAHIDKLKTREAPS
jgi:Transposase DDE domain